MLNELTKEQIKRYWQKVNKTKNCWLWQGAKYAKNYGAVMINGKLQAAHRISYLLSKGRLTKGLEINHMCGNTLCVNPKHLEEITHRENVLKGHAPAALHAKKIQCPKGHYYTVENIIWENNRRRCKTCRLEQVRNAVKRYKEKKVAYA